jgi:transcriptional regulator with XRE-family HTH domain
MPPTPFGERLKREREMRGVTIQEIATATRISPRFLEALENEHWDRLPGGVFNRGFIRSIARFLGLDEESLVAEYALGTRTHPEARAPASRLEEIPRDWRPIAVAALVLGVILGGIFALYHYGPGVVSRIRARRHTAPQVARVAPEPVRSADPTGVGAAIRGVPSLPLALQVEVTKPVAVKVIADGKVVFSGRLRRKEIKKFEAHQSFEIASTQPDALRLELNGESVPSLGSPRKPGDSLTLTRADLKPVAGVGH